MALGWVIVGVSLIMVLVGVSVAGIYAGISATLRRDDSAPGELSATVMTPSGALTTSTTAPLPLELLALRGRPASPVNLDPALCAAPLRPGVLVPGDSKLWNPGLKPATEPLTEGDVRAEVATIMRRRFRNDNADQAVKDALSLYDSERFRTVTGGNPSLRAGLAELKGTLGEPALQFLITTDRPVTIAFGELTRSEAGAEAQGDGYRLRITVRTEFTNERPALIAPILFHELLHQNGGADFDEELLASALGFRVILEQLRDDPEQVGPMTDMARGTRWAALAQLNNRVGSDMTLTRSEATTLFPHSVGPPEPSIPDMLRASDWAALYADLPVEPTPGHATLAAVLETMAPGQGPATADFDDTTIAFVDTHPGVGPCDQLIAAAALGVLAPGTAAARAANTYLHNLPA
jgi:hypothetical protein